MPQSNNRQRRGDNTTPVDNNFAHLQPQAPEVEKAVLGSLLIDRDAFGIIGDILKPESFYEPRNQMIFDAIRELIFEGAPVDVLTVTDKLQKLGKLEEVGGPSYVAEISSRVASSANIEYHANVVAQKALARNLISLTSIAQTKAFDESNDIEEVIQEAEQALFSLADNSGRKSCESMETIMTAVDSQLHLNASGNGMTGVPTGYTRFDEITSGLQPTDLVIIAGRPAMGKTALAVSIIKNTAIDRDIPVGFMSMEMSNVQVGNRIMSNVCSIEGNKFMNGQFDPSDWLRYDKKLPVVKTKPLYVDDTPNMSIFELKTKARRMAREHGIKLLIVDYLQLMSAAGIRYGNRQEEVATISRALKGLAKELNIPVVALSQLNRSVESREGLEGKRPQLSDLRESGAIEQDADVVIFVHRPEYYHIYNDDKGNDLHGKAQIIIAKHRKGAVDDVLLNFKGQFTRFEDPDADQNAPFLEKKDLFTSSLET